MQDVARLAVWRKAHAFTVSLNGLLIRRGHGFPGLRSQILRAAASIGANLAEGCGKGTAAEFLRFIAIASGSTKELQNHLLLARDCGTLAGGEYARLEEQRDEIARMLYGLDCAVRRRQPPHER
jgi:four helix bundle protein